MTINTALFAPVLDWLDRGAPETATSPGFSMNYIAQTNELDFQGQRCGTVCCIAGALATFNPQLGLNPFDFNEDRLAKALGITFQVGNDLFYPDDFSMETGNSYTSITPAHAARTIRNLIATGEVDWIGTMQ